MKKAEGPPLSLGGIFQNQKFKILLFYLVISLTFIETFKTMQVSSDNLIPGMLIYRVLPYAEGTEDSGTLLRNYIYYCTNLVWNKPITLMTNVLPIMSFEKNCAFWADADIPGFFEKNNERFSLHKNGENYSPGLPTLQKVDLSVENYKDPYYLLKNFVTGEGTLEIDADFLKQWDFYDLMTKPLRLNEETKGPKILIFHTHAREKFQGGQTVVDVGEKLKNILEKEYHIPTMHVTNEFYKDETQNVTGSYELMEPVIKKVLAENPSIDMCIDIHRDGVSGDYKFLTNINGKDTAKFMFFNGVCMNRDVSGNLVKMKKLQNPYLEDNLALSFQMQAIALKYYPGLTRKIYFKEYRYSLHMKPLSMLIELGNQNNTGEEALNAVEPMANIIAKVLEKD